jgi:hypothetical protein
VAGMWDSSKCHGVAQPKEKEGHIVPKEPPWFVPWEKMQYGE